MELSSKVAGSTSLGLPKIRKLRLKISVIAKSEEEIEMPESYSHLPVKRMKMHLTSSRR